LLLSAIGVQFSFLFNVGAIDVQSLLLFHSTTIGVQFLSLFPSSAHGFYPHVSTQRVALNFMRRRHTATPTAILTTESSPQLLSRVHTGSAQPLPVDKVLQFRPHQQPLRFLRISRTRLGANGQSVVLLLESFTFELTLYSYSYDVVNHSSNPPLISVPPQR